MLSDRSSVRLGRIVERARPIAVIGDVEAVEITDVAFDDRSILPGGLFCCLVGEHHDGHDFAGAARQAGAAAFIAEHSLGRAAGGAPQIIVAPGTARAAMAIAACSFFDDPATDLSMAGVTGTNGKTTTTCLLKAIFEQNGWRSGTIGTLDGRRTTPESPHLQRTLARLRKEHYDAVAMEVTSHALVQRRVDGIVFDVAVFTNLSQDHLDFHETLEAYFLAKADLFTKARARVAVVNRDDPFGRRLIDRPGIPTCAYSLDDVRELDVGVTSSTFRLGGRLVRLGLGGRFNVYNAIAAAAAARALGVGVSEIVAGLEAATPVPGRFEAITSANGITAVVDFAHTPAGLEEVLRAARNVTRPVAPPRRNDVGVALAPSVIVVFGCGGDRDRGKRPAMGAIAGALADFVVLTNDNPRSEDPLMIIEDVLAGIPERAAYVIELDRRRAIAHALSMAHPGDVVVIAGKGHETRQEFGHHTIEFDDRAVVRQELALLGEPKGSEGFA